MNNATWERLRLASCQAVRRRSWRLIVAGLALALLAVLLVTYRLSSISDLSYGGHTLSYWIALTEEGGHGGRLTAAQEQAYQALRVIGTNNLELLVHQLAHEPEKSFRVKFLRALPARVARSPFWNLLWQAEARQLHQSASASKCLVSLGPSAAPAVPQLKRIVDTGGQQQAVCALNVIASVGEPGLPTLVSTACSTNESLRLQAIMLLEPYTNRPAALCVLTNALRDPNPRVQATAAGVLDGRLFE